MSSLLEKAILDAKALKEAAERTAEVEILEKYHHEVKEALDNLLSEQEDEDPMLAAPEEEDPLAGDELGGELGGDLGDDVAMEDPAAGIADDMTMTEEEPAPSSVVKAPMGFAGGEKLCPCPDDGDEIEINLDSLMGAEDVGYDEDEKMQGPDSGALMEQEEVEEIIATNGMSDGDDLEEIISTNGAPGQHNSSKMSPEEEYRRSDRGSVAQADLANKLASMRKNESSMMGAGDISGAPVKSVDKEITEEELTEEIVEAVLASLSEEMEVDFEPVGSGTLNTNSAEFKETAEAVLAKETSDSTEEAAEEQDLKKQVRDLQEAFKRERAARIKDRDLFKKKYQSQVKAVNSVKEEKESILTTAKKLEEKLTEMNATNAKLLYTNRILSDNSLNERQKNKVVEALKKTNSFDEAKTVYETLKTAVSGTNRDTESKSLNEAMSGRMSPFLVRERRSNERKEDVVAERFKKLAGIK